MDRTGWYALHDDGKECLLKLPHVAGDEWENSYTVEGLSVKARYRAATVIQVTPPGPTTAEVRTKLTTTFNRRESTTESRWRYANDVGLVESEDSLGAWTLKEFTPGKE